MLDKQDLNRLYRYAWSLAKDDTLAFDLVQSTIEKVLRRNTIKIDNPVNYIMSGIRNEFIDHTRRSRKFETLSIDESLFTQSYEVTPDLESILIDEQDVEWIIDRLNPLESELLYLWAVEEYTIDEIAAMQDTPRGTLLSRISRLKKRLKSDVEKNQTLRR
jgi:RNA polymerase sigma-70 factor (ECF subfamily)